MTLKVIGTGLPRTGTASLKGALQMLGYDKTYHMDNLLNNPAQVVYWEQLFDQGETDYEALFDGFVASTDFPGFFAYRALLRKYPQAKFILTVRDPETWYESINNTVYQAVTAFFQQDEKVIHNSKVTPVFRLLDNHLFKAFFAGTFPDKARTLAIVESYQQEVIDTIPADQLLIYEIADGWDPLCAFLDCPVPDLEFPFKNKRGDFNAMIAKMLSGQKLEVK